MITNLISYGSDPMKTKKAMKTYEYNTQLAFLIYSMNNARVRILVKEMNVKLKNII